VVGNGCPNVSSIGGIDYQHPAFITEMSDDDILAKDQYFREQKSHVLQAGLPHYESIYVQKNSSKKV
jgi:hypothetical protein